MRAYTKDGVKYRVGQIELPTNWTRLWRFKKIKRDECFRESKRDSDISLELGEQTNICEAVESDDGWGACGQVTCVGYMVWSRDQNCGEEKKGSPV